MLSESILMERIQILTINAKIFKVISQKIHHLGSCFVFRAIPIYLFYTKGIIRKYWKSNELLKISRFTRFTENAGLTLIYIFFFVLKAKFYFYFSFYCMVEWTQWISVWRSDTCPCWRSSRYGTKTSYIFSTGK